MSQGTSDSNDRSGFAAGAKVGGGRFILERELGRGGMGVVWLAQDTVLKEPVALKFLPREVSRDAGVLDDLLRETRKSRKLSHPNIVRIHDLCQFEGERPFISMEFIEGSNLGALKVAQPGRCLSWEYVRPFALQLCAALAYAHGEGIAHRDLKPANLMVDTRGRLKLADFGISASITDSMSRVSMDMGSSGTPAYMSPQQMNGCPPAATDDLYALGATLYELLTSKPPFYTGSVVHQIQTVPPDPLEQRLARFGLQNDIPPEVSAAIMGCLAKEPEQRPPSAEAVALWVGLNRDPGAKAPLAPAAEPLPAESFEPVAEAELLKGDLADVAAAPVVESESPGRKRSPLVAVAAGVAMAVLVAVGAWALWGKKANSGSADNHGGGDVAKAEALRGETVVKAASAAQPFAPGGRWTNSIGMVFVSVPGTIVRFSIWQTRKQDFEAFVSATGHDATKGMTSWRSEGNWQERGDSWNNHVWQQGPTHPVCGVGWDDARAFCNWLTEQEREAGRLGSNQSYRLPTDAEWSVAVGLGIETGSTPAQKDGENKGVYPWGNQWPPPKGAGNFAGSEGPNTGKPALISGYRDDFGFTSPVGSFSANRFGLYDLGGNVSEWCEDLYGVGGPGQKRQEDWRAGARVLRGGAWCFGQPENLESSKRHGPTGQKDERCGFRCVLAGAGGEINSPSSMALPSTSPPPKAVTNPAVATAAKGAKQSAGSSSPSPASGTSNVRRTNTLGQVFVPVPGTTVLFSIWETRKQDFEAFVSATSHDATQGMTSWRKQGGWAVRGNWKNPGWDQSPTHPVCGVSWSDAKAFCDWLTNEERKNGKLTSGQRYRLPTDAEWSLAVGLGPESGSIPAEKDSKIKGVYPWGTQWPPPKGAGNYADSRRSTSFHQSIISGYQDDFPFTAPVGSFSANRFGLYDLGGNVAEWCEELYGLGGPSRAAGDDTWRPQSRVLRGASWLSGSEPEILSSRRGYLGQREDMREDDCGFRCVLETGGSALSAPKTTEGAVPAVSASVTTARGIPPPAGLIHWWRMVGGEVTDVVGGAKGTWDGKPEFVQGKVGLAFKGVYTVENKADLNFAPYGPMTVELWAFRTGNEPTGHLLGKRSGLNFNYQLCYDERNGLTGGLQFGGGPGRNDNADQAVSGLPFPKNTWVHLAGTADTSGVALYLNGIQIARKARPLAPINTFPLRLGNAGNFDPFPGFLAEISFYNRALTPAEIKAIYDSGANGKRLPASFGAKQP